TASGNATVQTADGQITITGTGTGSDAVSYGVFLQTGGPGATIASSGAGTIAVTGTASGTSTGIFAASTGHNIGSATGTGNVTLIADTMDFANIGVRAGGAGVITVKPFTASRQIEIGT